MEASYSACGDLRWIRHEDVHHGNFDVWIYRFPKCHWRDETALSAAFRVILNRPPHSFEGKHQVALIPADHDIIFPDLSLMVNPIVITKRNEWSTNGQWSFCITDLKIFTDGWAMEGVSSLGVFSENQIIELALISTENRGDFLTIKKFKLWICYYFQTLTRRGGRH